ncbi:MAG: TrmH family RNA methyltransferase [Candidatus Taylorbacteria bacterium]|nr:TrmH family RNA methyltransferase [Candidatus Taylorbacteria bacterium]
MKKDAYVLLHDIRSVFNVGAIFRTADALGITKIYLSGFSPTPLDRFGNERKDFVKVSLGAEKTVAWEFIKEPFILIDELKKKGTQIVSVEQASNSIDYKKVEIKIPVLFIFGREVEGIEQKLLEKSDIVAEITMSGKKESLNVAVAAGIVLFRLLDTSHSRIT